MSVYFLGAANPETLRMIAAVRRSTPNFAVGGFLDNDVTKHGASFFEFQILGGVERVAELALTGAKFVNLITGSTLARYETTKQIVDAGGTLTNFLHPSIDLTMTKMGVGNYLQESVILQAAVTLGDNCSIHMAAIVGHESTIGHSVFIAHAVSISGACSVGDGTFIGTNATLLPRVSIGRWATIGAGAVVTKDVPDYAVVVGNPAKVVRFNDARYRDAMVRSH